MRSTVSRRLAFDPCLPLYQSGTLGHDPMSFWTDQRVVVTGGAGFVGSFVVDRLRAAGCQRVVVPRAADYDLRDVTAVRRMLVDAKPNLVIHLAAKVGGIGA